MVAKLTLTTYYLKGVPNVVLVSSTRPFHSSCTNQQYALSKKESTISAFICSLATRSKRVYARIRIWRWEKLITVSSCSIHIAQNV